MTLLALITAKTSFPSPSPRLFATFRDHPNDLLATRQLDHHFVVDQPFDNVLDLSLQYVACVSFMTASFFPAPSIVE